MEQVSNDMLDDWTVSATYDQLADRVRERCTGVFDTILLDLPPKGTVNLLIADRTGAGISRFRLSEPRRS